MPGSKSARFWVGWIAASLACSLPGSGNVATSVSATLTAVVTAGTPAVPELAPSPTDTPLAPSATPPAPVLRVVYLDGGNVMLIEEGAAPVDLTTSGDAESVRISSDGMKIVYTRRLAPGAAIEMRSLNKDGTADFPILTPAILDGLYALPPGTVAVDISDFAFLPGTHTVVFNTLALPEIIGLIKFDDLLTVNADSGAIATLLSPGAGGDFAVSPDGSQIAFARPQSIHLINSDGTNLRSDLVAYPAVITYSEYEYYAVPTWSGDSSAAGVAIPSSDPLAAATTGAIWILPANGSPATHLADIPGDFFFSQRDSPSLSPDLSQVGFFRDTAAPNVSDLTLANADGSNESPYVTGSITWLGWSPSGSQFAFSFGTALDIRLGTPGGGPVPLAVGDDLRWINATEFLFLSGGFGAWTLERGQVGAGSVPLASPTGDFIPYDFDS